LAELRRAPAVEIAARDAARVRGAGRDRGPHVRAGDLDGCRLHRRATLRELAEPVVAPAADLAGEHRARQIEIAGVVDPVLEARVPAERDLARARRDPREHPEGRPDPGSHAAVAGAAPAPQLVVAERAAVELRRRELRPTDEPARERRHELQAPVRWD